MFSLILHLLIMRERKIIFSCSPQYWLAEHWPHKFSPYKGRIPVVLPCHLTFPAAMQFLFPPKLWKKIPVQLKQPSTLLTWLVTFWNYPFLCSQEVILKKGPALMCHDAFISSFQEDLTNLSPKKPENCSPQIQDQGLVACNFN